MKRLLCAVIALSIFILACSCPLPLSVGPSPRPTLRPRRTSVVTFSPTPMVAADTPLPQATNTLAPTNTPVPTSTPVPADTPVPTPTPSPAPGPFTLAFASDRQGNGEIYRYDSESGQLTNLTSNPAVDWDPAWSPDGTLLAFTTHRQGNSEIDVMAADGSNLTNVTNHPMDDYMPSWSPDGQRLVFVSERDGNQEIYIINRDGSEATRLTVNDKPDADRAPVWSPDGTKIAFAGVRNGVEGIHTIKVDGTGEAILTHMPLKGASPAWSPEGTEIAFVGWDEEDRPGLYVMNADGSDQTWLMESKAWIGSLHWTAGGGWLLFTSWQDENHELYAVRPDGSGLTRLTSDLAWDDAPDLSPGGGDFQPVAGLPLSPPPPSVEAPPLSRLQLGVNLADLGKSYLVRDMGFAWVRTFIDWSGIEPQQKGQYDWIDPDNIVKACGSQGLKIMMRVQWTPRWARPPETDSTHPPTNPQDFADFMRAVATRYRGQVAAYEIWNEPNLNREWGWRPASPAEYVALLQAVYPALKEADPQALVVAGGPSTTGGGGQDSMGDLDYLRGIYQAGGAGFFDAISSHPYAFGHDPDYHDEWGLSFTRAASQHQVMVESGDETTPLWITELGWVMTSAWDLGEHAQWAVTEEQQAEYLARAYRKAEEEWPWVGAMFLFNLDFSGVIWYDAGQIMRWYAIIHPDRSPRLAYTQLRMMARGVQ